MARARVGDIEIEYEITGNDSDPALLLVAGFGQQLIGWDPDLRAKLAALGLRLIAYDHRDIGLSTKMDGLGLPPMGDVLKGAARLPYALDDLADDAVGLLDAIGIEKAHVLGASMGGMIAQLIAIRHPGRVLSLVSVMSTTGDTEVPSPSDEALAVLTRAPADTHAGRVEQIVEGARVLASPGYPFDEAWVRARAEAADTRSFYPDGVGRQLMAILSASCRDELLADVKVPALVIHGEADPLIDCEGGKLTAKAIPGSELRLLPDVGHELPEPVWNQVVADIGAFLPK